MQVREIMTAPPITCSPQTSLSIAASHMADADCGILPVIDDRRKLVGVITDRDICLAVSRTNRNALNISVREVMTRKVVSVGPGDDMRRALALMRSARVRRVPVVDDAGCVVGLLSIDDLVVRGSPLDDVAAREIVETLHDMAARRPRAA
jgi:CBS domain-containing protein